MDSPRLLSSRYLTFPLPPGTVSWGIKYVDTLTALQGILKGPLPCWVAEPLSFTPQPPPSLSTHTDERHKQASCQPQTCASSSV